MSNELPAPPPAEWFDRRWNPQALLESVLAHMDAIPSDALFNNPALKPVREAHAAAKFATIRAQARHCEVRMVDLPLGFPILKAVSMTRANNSSKQKRIAKGVGAAMSTLKPVGA